MGNYRIARDEAGRVTLSKSKALMLVLGIVGILALLTGLGIAVMVGKSVLDGEPRLRAMKGMIIYLGIGTLCSLCAWSAHTIVIDACNRSVEFWYLLGLYRRIVDSGQVSHVRLQIDDLPVQGYTVALARATGKEIGFEARGQTGRIGGRRTVQFACWLAGALGIDLRVDGEPREFDEELALLLDGMQDSAETSDPG